MPPCPAARCRRHRASLAGSSAVRRNFLILLDEPHAWVAAAALTRLAPPGAVEALVAPVPGVAFLAAQGQAGSELDAWWQRTATAPGRPVVLAAHERDLPRWIPGLDADFVVAVPDDETLATYRPLANVLATVDDDPRQLAELALGDLARPPVRELPPYVPAQDRQVWERPGPSPHATAYDPHNPRAPRPAPPLPPPVAPAVSPPPPPQPLHRRPDPGLPGTDRIPVPGPAAAPAADRAVQEPPAFVDPFDLLARAEPAERPGPPEGGGVLPPGLVEDVPPLSRRTMLGDQRPQPVPAAAAPRPRPGPRRPRLDP